MSSPDLTVIYFTASVGKEDFETEIRKTLLETIQPLDLPLISVSQKPLDFGENICVGDVGVSSSNGFRQLQIGAKAAKTKFVCIAESDYLYPRQYFEFIPEREDTFYVAVPTWLFDVRTNVTQRVFCRKPEGDAGAMIVGRDMLIDRIQTILGPRSTWSDAALTRTQSAFLLKKSRINYTAFDVGAPIVTFKTDGQLHFKHPIVLRSKCTELPHWGSAESLARKYAV
jgi:hypothetical protein